MSLFTADSKTYDDRGRLFRHFHRFTVEQQQKLSGIQAGATVGSDDIDRIMTANNGDVMTANNGNCMITNRVS